MQGILGGGSVVVKDMWLGQSCHSSVMCLFILGEVVKRLHVVTASARMSTLTSF